MKTKNLPIFFYTDDFNNIQGIHVSTKGIPTLKAHRHEFYELEYILEGETYCEINGTGHHLHAGDLAFITPLDVHSYTVLGGREAITTTVHFNLDNLGSDFLILAELPTFIMKGNKELKEAFETLAVENKEDKFQYLAKKNMLERIVILFLRGQDHFEPQYIPLEITYAIGYIIKNFNTPLTLEEVSEKCSYSTAYFCKQFKKYTGKSFVEYLTDIRIKHARNMLVSQKVSVTQICYECGFGSVRSLNRIFHEKYGCSPSEYQKNSKAANSTLPQ